MEGAVRLDRLELHGPAGYFRHAARRPCFRHPRAGQLLLRPFGDCGHDVLLRGQGRERGGRWPGFERGLDHDPSLHEPSIGDATSTRRGRRTRRPTHRRFARLKVEECRNRMTNGEREKWCRRANDSDSHGEASTGNRTTLSHDATVACSRSTQGINRTWSGCRDLNPGPLDPQIYRHHALHSVASAQLCPNEAR